MLLLDVNVLVYAFREDASQHASYREWLEGAIQGEETVGIADVVLSGFLRITTHPSIWAAPSSLEQALAFTSALRGAPGVEVVQPTDSQWDIFAGICRSSQAYGNVIPDAFIAALAIDSRSELITTDAGFARFPGLRWRHPLG
jgi:uncharacterized protein